MGKRPSVWPFERTTPLLESSAIHLVPGRQLFVPPALLGRHLIMSANAIHVTQPFLPPLEEFLPCLQRIWDNKILTNGGPFHQQLEQALCDYLGVPDIALFSNGTLALMTALQALDIGGEVITTPYSFVATAHALLWNGLKPVFVDVDPQTFNIDPAAIEAAITPDTTAILPVHCYGNPCDVEAIRDIARRRGLKVVYDAAHAFGVKDAGGSVLRHGDLSVLSFHATKVFNTFEGGAIVCPDAETKQRLNSLKNFGITGETTVAEAGLNAKMNEMQAGFGLLQLRHIDDAIARRAMLWDAYMTQLAGIDGIRCPSFHLGSANYAYFPILVEAAYAWPRDVLYQRLREAQIYARRYFYPLISDIPMYRAMASGEQGRLPHARRLSESVICLPLHPGLALGDVQRVSDFIRAAGR